MRIRVGLLIGLVGAGVAGCGSPREAPPAAKPAVTRYSVADFYKNCRVLRGVVLARRHEDPGLVQHLGHLERLRRPHRGRRAPAADAVDDQLDLRRVVLPRRRPHPLLERRGRQRAQPRLRARPRTARRRPHARQEAERELLRLGRRRQVVLRLHQRARPALLRPVRVRGRRLHADAVPPEHRRLRPRPDLARQAVPRAREVAHDVNDADICLIDRQTSTHRRTSRRTRATSTTTPADFSPDGTTLLFISDAGREFKSLRSLRSRHRPAEAGLRTATGTSRAPSTRRAASTSTVCDQRGRRLHARALDAATLQAGGAAGHARRARARLEASRDDSTMAFYASDGSVPDELYAGQIGAAPARLTNALNPEIKREDLVVPTRRALQVVRRRRDSRPAVQAAPGHAVGEGPGDRHGPRRPRRPGAVRLLRPDAGAGQPRVRRVRHQQPRQHRLRQDLLRHGRPQARRSRPGRRRRQQADARRHRLRRLRRASASSAAATAATWCWPR